MKIEYDTYEEWTVSQLDENDCLVGDFEEFIDYDKAVEYFDGLVCEYSPDLGVRLSHHTDWEDEGDMATSHTWSDITTHYAGKSCPCGAAWHEED